jgi:predicted HTH transcriptional regulator
MQEIQDAEPKKRGFKEYFARFLENPTREGLRDILKNHFGETENLDFKKSWESWPKTAKHILGFANSGGGCIIYGVLQKEDGSFDPVGLEKIVDKAEVMKGVQNFILDKLKFEILDFAYEESEYPKIKGKKFQILLIEDNPKCIPFISLADGEGIRKNAIYIRRKAETIEADYEGLQEVINRRVETTYSSKSENEFEKQLTLLKVLYQLIPKRISMFEISSFPYSFTVENPNYPEETFEGFIKKLIELQKKRILNFLSGLGSKG